MLLGIWVQNRLIGLHVEMNGLHVMSFVQAVALSQEGEHQRISLCPCSSSYTSGGFRENPFIHAQRLSLDPCMLSEGRFIHVQRISLSDNRFMHVHTWPFRFKLVFKALHSVV